MSETLETTTIRTVAPFGKPRIISEKDAKAVPADKVTVWNFSHSEPLIETELAAARQVTASGLIAVSGLVHEEGARLVKGSVYLQLLGKTVTRTEGDKAPVSFTPTPDEVNRMPKAVLREFAMLLEYGKLPSEGEAEEKSGE